MNASNTDIISREKRRQELGDTEFNTGAQGGALMQPRNGKELMDMANLVSQSGTMVRDFYRGSPGDCAALIMICQPYGFNPYQVSWKTYKASKSADAPVSFEAQLVQSMVNMSAPIRGRLRYSYANENTDMLTCTVTGIDRDTGEEITYTSPPLKQIPVKNSPLWKGDPQQQLGYYSARAWARRHFPELLLGVYTREEIEEAPRIRDVTPEATGGWADKARAARGEVMPADEAPDEPKDVSPDVPDAELVPDDDPADPEFDEDAVDAMTDAYDEGFKSSQEGEAELSPYEPGTEEWNNWIGGYRFFKDNADKANSDEAQEGGDA